MVVDDARQLIPSRRIDLNDLKGPRKAQVVDEASISIKICMRSDTFSSCDGIL